MDPDPHGSGTFPGSGIIVPGLDPAKNERADKKYLILNFRSEFCTVGLYYEIENARQLLDSSFWLNVRFKKKWFSNILK